MNFLSMDYFLMTAEKRSFTKAADALHITQQTLSTHIANLEQELDCKLFVRHVPLELTYAGEIFCQYAADFQKKYRAMQHEFADLTKNEQGILRICMFFLRKAHIGEIQSSLWPDEVREEAKKAGIPLL